MLMWGWHRLGMAFLCGALSALAFAPFHFFPILFLTFPVFIWLLDGTAADPANTAYQRIKAFFKTGWAFGFGFHLAGMWWVGNAFLVDAQDFMWLLPVAVIALPAILAVFTGAACSIARLLWSESWARIFLFAAAFSLMEYARGYLLTGLPWNLIGYAAMPTPVAMQSASLIGTYGVTLLIIPVICLAACLTNSDKSARGFWLLCLYAAVISAGHLGYGYQRLSTASNEMVDGVSLRVVQPNISQKDKWNPEKEGEILNRLLTTSTATSNNSKLSDATHLIWPESAFPFILTERRDALAAIAAMLPDGTSLITGAARREAAFAEGKEPFVFNSVYVINSDGIVEGAADKTHLVPFGEYLPFQSELEALGIEQLTRVRGGFEAGNSRKTLSAGNAPPFLPLICYEIIFPSDVIAGTKGAEWIINVTNDAWFGNTPGPSQHFHQSVVRAVEEGLPLVRAANTGISAVVDSYGRTLKKLEINNTGHLDTPLPVKASSTFFSLYGNMPFTVLILVFFATAFIAKRR